MLNRDSSSTVVGLRKVNDTYLSHYRKSSPSYILVEAVMCPFHRFPITSEGSIDSSVSYNPIFFDRDWDDMQEYWFRFNEIMLAGTGSRNVISMSNFVDYMQAVNELQDIVHSLMALKTLVDLDFKSILGYDAPAEIIELKKDLGLDSASWESIWRPLVVRAAKFKCPPELTNFNAAFHAPFTRVESGCVYSFNTLAQIATGSSAQLSITTSIRNLCSLLEVSEAYSLVSSVLHNFTSFQPCIGEVPFISNSPVHGDVLQNIRTGRGSQTSVSMYECEEKYVFSYSSYLTGTVPGTVSEPSENVFSLCFTEDPTSYIYAYMLGTEPTVGGMLMHPLYQRNSAAPGISYHTAVANHGVTAFGDFFTTDAEFNQVYAPNVFAYLPSEDDAGIEATDMLAYMNLSSHRTNQAFGIINGQVKIDDHPEQYDTYYVFLDSIKGSMFGNLLNSIAQGQNLLQLGEITQQAGIRTSRV